MPKALRGICTVLVKSVPVPLRTEGLVLTSLGPLRHQVSCLALLVARMGQAGEGGTNGVLQAAETP